MEAAAPDKYAQQGPAPTVVGELGYWNRPRWHRLSSHFSPTRLRMVRWYFSITTVLTQTKQSRHTTTTKQITEHIEHSQVPPGRHCAGDRAWSICLFGGGEGWLVKCRLRRCASENWRRLRAEALRRAPLALVSGLSDQFVGG